MNDRMLKCEQFLVGSAMPETYFASPGENDRPPQSSRAKSFKVEKSKNKKNKIKGLCEEQGTRTLKWVNVKVVWNQKGCDPTSTLSCVEL